MKKIAPLFISLLVAGCIGSPTPRNPMDRKTKSLWWQKSTAGVEDSPWEIYVKKPKVKAKPSLFPKNWKHAKQKKSSNKQLY